MNAIMAETLYLFTLGPTLRGISHKEWEIPLPSSSVEDYSFYPEADIVAFAIWQRQECVHLPPKFLLWTDSQVTVRSFLSI